MSSGTLYWLLKHALDVTVWGGELVTDAGLPRHGPAVFVANHAGAIGPIGIAASLPLRLYPWVIGDMLDRQSAGAYLLKDFVKPELHVPDGLAAPFSSALARITVSLLQNIECIPVWHDRELMETYRLSDDYLAAGRSLLVFPEDPQEPINSRTGLRPFKSGFAHVGSLYFARTRSRLSFYPIAVHRAARRVEVGDPILYDPLNEAPAERRRLAHGLESMIAEMLAGADGGLSLDARRTA